MKVPLTGGAAKTLASGQADPVGIAVDAVNAYWTSNFHRTVMAVAK